MAVPPDGFYSRECLKRCVAASVCRPKASERRPPSAIAPQGDSRGCHDGHDALLAVPAHPARVPGEGRAPGAVQPEEAAGALRLDQPAPVAEWQGEGDPRAELLPIDRLSRGVSRVTPGA